MSKFDNVTPFTMGRLLGACRPLYGRKKALELCCRESSVKLPIGLEETKKKEPRTMENPEEDFRGVSNDFL